LKKVMLSMFFVLMGILLVACSSSNSASSSEGSSGSESNSSGSSDKVYEISVAHSSPAENDRLEASILEFKKEVEEKSNGQISVKTFPASQLGSEREQLEGVQLGSIEMAVITTGPLPGIYADSMVFDLPFLFKNEEIAAKVLDGSVGQEILQGMLDQTGVRGLAWGENGFRHFTNSVKPIKKPEDLKGLKIRTMENPAHMHMVTTLGASPTPMGAGEIYSGLQQGVIDGQENPVSIIESFRIYEVNKYATLSGHVYSPYIMMINDSFYQGLPEDLQKVVSDAAANWSKVERELNQKQVAEGVNVLKENGMEVIELTNEEKKAFQEATEPTYEKYRKELGEDLIDKVLKEIEKVEKELS
jgi:tripartite ATP-independent transporter DctP family solute receptor